MSFTIGGVIYLIYHGFLKVTDFVKPICRLTWSRMLDTHIRGTRHPSLAASSDYAQNRRQE